MNVLSPMPNVMNDGCEYRVPTSAWIHGDPAAFDYVGFDYMESAFYIGSISNSKAFAQ